MFAELNVIFIGLGILFFVLLLFRFSEQAKKKKIDRFISRKLFNELVPTYSKTQRNLRFLMVFFALALMLLGIARPQWGVEQRTSNPRGIDVLVAVDVSKSMLARDVKPNRLERVKLGVVNLLEKVKSDRLGLITFSGSAFLQCPLTLDHQAFIKTLEDLQVGIIKTPGTNLAQPIDEASRSFAKDDNDRFLILLSDGEDLEGEGLKRAKAAKAEGIKIFTIGIGSPSGSFISTDPIGQPARNFLKDRDGTTVLTKLDEKSLVNIAEVTGGRYFSLGPTGEGLAKTFKILQKEGQQRRRSQLSTDLPIERFQPFVIFALLLIFLEMLTPSKKKIILKTLALALPLFFLGCFKEDNVKRAEMALAEGNPSDAANFYSLEINSSQKEGQPVEPKLFLNAGLAHMQANSFEQAASFLENALDSSVDDPELQSIALNALGNIFYKKTNTWLDGQNVSKARITWNKALAYYDSAFQLNGNQKAATNLESLKKQIQERIQSLVTVISGIIWRDMNGDGEVQKIEPRLRGIIFWDKDNNGELNATTEPKISTTEKGEFAFEWISGTYPTLIEIGSKINEGNQTDSRILVPFFPPPPPPLNSDSVLNHQISIRKPGTTNLAIPYRAAPLISGEIWSDKNGNGQREKEENGFSGAKIFIDTNGNFVLDENESTFSPDQNGKFNQAVPPGQHSVCIAPDNPDANITFPLDEKKAYLTWVNFETSSGNLNFGIQDDSENQEQNQESQQSSPQDGQQEENKEEKSPAQDDSSQEVNALYERLLQEMESKSKPLDQQANPVRVLNNGRDY
tara:strand:- start:4198 stop:6588 length:2391 start_codon:yes stop_codon:yes gene_type:complete